MGWYTRTFSLNNAQDIWKWDGTGEGSFFERATDRVRWIFIYTFNPRALCSRPPLVLRTIVLLFQTLFSRRAFNPILFSLRTFKSHHVFFFLHRLYIFIYRKTRGNERTRSSDRGEKLGNFEDPIETCQPLIPPLKEKLLFHPVAGDELHWNSACNRSRDEDVYIYIYIFIHASGTWLAAREGGGARVHRARKSFAKLQAVNFTIFNRASAIFSARISPPRRDNTSPPTPTLISPTEYQVSR